MLVFDLCTHRYDHVNNLVGFGPIGECFPMRMFPVLPSDGDTWR